MKKSKYIFVVLTASVMAKNPHHHLGLKHDKENDVLLHHGIEQDPLVAQFLKELGIQHTYESKEVEALNEIIGRLAKIDSVRIEREVKNVGKKATIIQHATLWAAEDSEKAMQQAWPLVQENIEQSEFLKQLLADVSALTYIQAKSITDTISDQITELARSLAIRAQEMKNALLYHVAKASHMHAPEDKTATSLQDAWSLLSGNVKKMKALLLQIGKNEEQLVKLHGGSIEDMQKSKLVTDHKYNGAEVWLALGYDKPWAKNPGDVQSYQTSVINAANLPVAELKAANPEKEKMEKWNLTEHSNFADFHAKQEEILHEITALCVSSNNQNANRIPVFVKLLLSLKDNQNEGISAAAEVAYVEYMYALYSCLISNRFLGQIDLVKEFGHNVRDARAHWRTLLSALNGDIGAQTSAQHTHAKKKAAHAKASASAANGANANVEIAAAPVAEPHQQEQQPVQQQNGGSVAEDAAIAGGAGIVVGAAAGAEAEHLESEHSAAPVAAPSAPAPASADNEEATPAHHAQSESKSGKKEKKEKSDKHSTAKHEKQDKSDKKEKKPASGSDEAHHQQHAQHHASAHPHAAAPAAHSNSASQKQADADHAAAHQASAGNGHQTKANPKKPSGAASSAGAAKRSPTPSKPAKQPRHASSSAKPKSSAKSGASGSSASSSGKSSRKKK